MRGGATEVKENSMAVDHQERASRAWPLLVARARSPEPPFTYGELSGLLGLHHRSAQWFLGVIQSYCKRHRLPSLQALAVNKKTRVPGRGYSGSDRSKTRHAKEVQRVKEANWPLQPPNFNE
jgi:hypothetical protein